MNWMRDVVRPKIQRVFRKRETPDDLWRKCPNCDEMIFHRDLVSALYVCPSCDFHMKMGTDDRFKMLFDGGTFEAVEVPGVPADPLKFRDQKKYPDRLKEARAKTGKDDSVTVAHGALDGVETVIAVQDFSFLGGSLGMAAGEAIIAGAQKAVEKNAPYVVVLAAGGARMQEGILSLMQMPRTTVAVQMLRDAGLPYIVVLTDPTTGGVTASYGMLGDIQLAEPGALIGFAGPRVIEQTIREKLPEGFQRAEYLLEHGMVDQVVRRPELKATLGRIIRLLTHRHPEAPGAKDAVGGDVVPLTTVQAKPSEVGPIKAPAEDVT